MDNRNYVSIFKRRELLSINKSNLKNVPNIFFFTYKFKIIHINIEPVRNSYNFKGILNV